MNVRETVDAASCIDDLLDACKASLEVLESLTSEEYDEKSDAIEPWLDRKLRAAIAKAETSHTGDETMILRAKIIELQAQLAEETRLRIATYDTLMLACDKIRETP